MWNNILRGTYSFTQLYWERRRVEKLSSRNTVSPRKTYKNKGKTRNE
jgi:hypothetical protein